MSRGRSNNKRQASNKRRTVSSQAKRPISPSVNAFYGKVGAGDHNNHNLMTHGNYQNKFISATNGFEIYNKVEKAYSNTKPTKNKAVKRPSSKKQNRIRYSLLL